MNTAPRSLITSLRRHAAITAEQQEGRQRIDRVTLIVGLVYLLWIAAILGTAVTITP